MTRAALQELLLAREELREVSAKPYNTKPEVFSPL
jgi:hypothetical protein